MIRCPKILPTGGNRDKKNGFLRLIISVFLRVTDPDCHLIFVTLQFVVREIDYPLHHGAPTTSNKTSNKKICIRYLSDSHRSYFYFHWQHQSLQAAAQRGTKRSQADRINNHRHRPQGGRVDYGFAILNEGRRLFSNLGL